METVTDPDDVKVLKGLIEDHKKYTGSTPASEILGDWDVALKKFKKIMPRDYRRVLAERKHRVEESSERELEAANNG